MLLSLVAVLALVAGGLFAWDASRDDDAGGRRRSSPVVIGSDDATAGGGRRGEGGRDDLDPASYQDYDEQVDEATAMMTDDFAKEFRQTADDVKDEFVAARPSAGAEVVAQGVVTASDQQVRR